MLLMFESGTLPQTMQNNWKECYYCKKRSHHQSLFPQQFGFYAETAKELRDAKTDTKNSNTSTSTNLAPKVTNNTRVVALAQNEMGTYMVTKAKIENILTKKTMEASSLTMGAIDLTLLIEWLKLFNSTRLTAS